MSNTGVKYEHLKFVKVTSRWDGINWSGICKYRGDIYKFNTSVVDPDSDEEWELACDLEFIKTPLFTKIKRWWKAKMK